MLTMMVVKGALIFWLVYFVLKYAFPVVSKVLLVLVAIIGGTAAATADVVRKKTEKNTAKETRA